MALWAIAAASAADPPCEDHDDLVHAGTDVSCAHIAAVSGCSHPEYGPHVRELCKKSCNSCQLCPATVNKTTITVANTASALTSADINLIPGVSGALPNVDYTSGLQSGTYVDPANPTPTEIQAAIDSVNVAINEDEAPVLPSARDDDDDGAGSFIFSKSRWEWEALRKAIERDIAATNARNRAAAAAPRPCSYDHQCDTNYYCHKTKSMFKSSAFSKTGSCKKSSGSFLAARHLGYRAHCNENYDCQSGRCRSGYMGGPNDPTKKQKICVCNTARRCNFCNVYNFAQSCPPGAYRCGGNDDTVCVGHRPVDGGECGKNDGQGSGTEYTETHSGKRYGCIKM